MCGEHALSNTMSASLVGSSPHVRGTLLHAHFRLLPVGIIPACAGNTRRRPSSVAIPRDHPRMCGEHSDGSCGCVLSWGSSPHVRGTLERFPTRHSCAGIIPACAGNTPRIRHPRGSHRDHPRMCGEHAMSRWRPLSITGSSPHVRGTPTACCRRSKRSGIIPACAGNTIGSPRTMKRYGDHPRMCGEHHLSGNAGYWSWGSSPHVRGTHEMVGESAVSFGIIPACAGNTASRSACGSTRRDHPRMCGEHLVAAAVALEAAGSSPHVRGTLDIECGGQCLHGIIPACAGNTSPQPAIPQFSRDHPRMCGEHRLRRVC